MKTLIFAALMVVATSAQAEFKNGNRLYEQMTGSNFDQMNAMGYVTGVADALNGVTYCPPATVTAGQLNDMVRNYLQQNPAIRHFTGDLIVRRVIEDMWPCEKKKGGAL